MFEFFSVVIMTIVSSCIVGTSFGAVFGWLTLLGLSVANYWMDRIASALEKTCRQEEKVQKEKSGSDGPLPKGGATISMPPESDGPPSVVDFAKKGMKKDGHFVDPGDLLQ